MFDWNDEELTNIIWGEAGESDDHIVPYGPGRTEEKPPVLIGDHTKKETDQHHASDISPLQHKRQTVKSECGDESDTNSTNIDVVGPGMDLWPDPPTSAVADITKSSEKDSGVFENPPEDGEQGDFDDYGWANIGSFDDLDRIFSSNDPIFGEISVANADELWPSSKNVTGPPLSEDSSDLPVGTLMTSIEQTETKAQYKLDPGQSFISCYDEPIDATSHASQDVQVLKQKKLSKCQKSSNRWINSSYAQPMVNHQSPPLVLSQQIPRQRPMPVQPLNHFPGAPLASPFYGNMMDHCSTGYHEVPTTSDNPSKNSESASPRPPEMTPKEKIEKLRRRQQMRAILAIQRQQLQFKSRASGSEHSSLEGGKVEVDESLVNFPSLEPNSPVEQYETNTISMGLDNSSVEESVLCRLQDTIATMDMRTRLCVRDSMFRLAQSAMLRQYPNDTSSASANSRDEDRSDKDIVSHERFTRIPDLETDTNPIDRTVARFLFHRPMEFSGKPVEIPESPLSANLPYVKNSKLESPSQFSEGNQPKSGICFLTCENAMYDGNADEG